MTNPTKTYWLCSAVIILASASFIHGGTVETEKARLKPQPTGRYWVFMQPEQMPQDELDRAIDRAADGLTPRSLERRRKVIDREPPVRLCDLPVSRFRIEAVERTGCRVVRHLRYINAITVTGSPTALERAGQLEFVIEIRPVMAYASLNRELSEPEEPHGGKSSSEQRISDDEEQYGYSWQQSTLVNIPEAHAAGYRGQGVLIGVQDTGFDFLDHRCFSGIEIVAMYDFLNDDDDVSDHGDIGSGRHGTRTLSVIAGLDSGRFIGAAPEARFVLTKTENTEEEMPIEEDLWIAGLWFHDSLGVDVLSSSLSYRDWYRWEDMDGRTAITSRAADSAASAGMVIVNSAGNTGNDDYPDNKIGAPADARLVISAGGVLRDGRHYQTASQGPTYDGRLKPNVAAQAASVYAASYLMDTLYTRHSGTSFSCPMLAGFAALVLQAHPWLTPVEVIDIIQRASNRAEEPDTLDGYGIPNAWIAVREAASRSVKTDFLTQRSIDFDVFPNPFNGRLNIRFNDAVSQRIIRLFDLHGRELGSFAIKGQHSELVTVDLSDYAAGVYLLRVDDRGLKVVLIR